jgi:hypothetical protein
MTAKEAILNLREFHGRADFLVVVRHDPSADGIAPHQP